MVKPKIAVACDHRGFQMKNALIQYLKTKNFEVVDCGTLSEASCDYPDFIIAAADAIAANLRKGQVIVLESTTYPGTTEEVILPKLEATGLKVGKDFCLGFSPERIDPGNKKFDTENTPKIIGGISEKSTELAKALYEQVIEKVIPVSSSKVAEMVKLLENTFRIVNIGLVNEIMLMCDKLGIDVWEVIEAAKTKPYGFMPFYPGPGVGGHCIPIDPIYLSWKARGHGFEARFIDLASHVNSQMPHYVVDKIRDGLNGVSMEKNSLRFGFDCDFLKREKNACFIISVHYRNKNGLLRN